MVLVKQLLFLTVIALTACSVLSLPASTQIESNKSANIPVIHKLYLVANLTGPTNLGGMMLDKTFDQTIINTTNACNVQTTSNFDEHFKVLRSNGFIMPPDAAEKDNKAEQVKISDFHPDAVLEIKPQSYTKRNSGLTLITYNATVTDYGSQRVFWSAKVDLHPADYDTSKGGQSNSAIMAQDIVNRLKADGVLQGCHTQYP